MKTALQRLLGASALVLVGVLWYWLTLPRPLSYNERRNTPTEGQNQTLIHSNDLRIGDKRFDDNTLTVRQGDNVPVNGRIVIAYDKINAPARSMITCMFALKCAPVKSPEKIWKTLSGKPGMMTGTKDDPEFFQQQMEESRRQGRKGIDWNVPRPKIVETVWRIRPEQYPVGEYETRLYLIVDVENTDMQLVHQIGRGRLSVLPTSQSQLTQTGIVP